MFLSSFDPRRARRTDGRRGSRARFGGWGRVLQNKGWPSFLRESVGRHEKLGHHRLESVAFEPAKFARPSTSRPRWLSSPAKPLVSKLGIIRRRQMMGHLKFWRGSPYPVRPFRSEDGGMMRAEERRGERATRKMAKVGGAEKGRRRWRRTKWGGKRPSKYFDT